jgi:hypothetical protein
MTTAIWRLEWRIALRRRRLFLLNCGIPLLLVAPLVLGGAPVFHAAAALAVLFVLFGTFGSAIPLLREGQSGLLRRILLAGAPESRILLERSLASTLVDFVQLSPSLLLVLLAWGAPAPVWAVLPPVLLLTLAVANLLGIWIAATARSLAEGALFAAVVSLFLLHGSGVFRTASPGSAGAFFEAILPFGPLHQLLLTAGGGAGTGIVVNLWAPGGAAMILLALTGVAARSLLDRIAPPEGPDRGG